MICLLAGCGKTEQGSRSDSDPFTWGFGYVHGQNEFFRSLLREGDPRIARADFGALMHAVEDFYSHSNWLETGQRNLAPIIPACAGLGLLGTLQTGFFRPDLYDPISGCPMDASGNPAPPAPFMYCHLTLHKDAPIGHD